jgi:hypothetical protein
MTDMNQTTECPLEKTYIRQAMTVLNAIQIMKAKDRYCGSKPRRSLSVHVLYTPPLRTNSLSFYKI